MIRMDLAEFIEKIEKIKLVYRILILVGTLALLGGLFFWLVYIPKTDEIESLTKKNVSLSQEITEAKQKTKDIDKFEADVAQVEAQYEEALTLLPKKEEIPNLLINITELGTTSNLEFKSFSPSSSKAAKGAMFSEIPISISVLGRYHDTLLFFDRVGKMKRIVNVQKVSMSPSGGEGDLNISCQLVTYKFQEKGSGKKVKKKKKKK